MQKWQEKVNFLMSYCNIEGIFIRMKIMKKTSHVNLYKKAKNCSEFMMFVLGGHIRPNSPL